MMKTPEELNSLSDNNTPEAAEKQRLAQRFEREQQGNRERNAWMYAEYERIKALPTPPLSEYERFYRNTVPIKETEIDRVRSDSYLKHALEEFANNPETKRLYDGILLEGDHELLTQKSRMQLKELEEFYIESNAENLSSAKEKLAAFHQWTSNLKPVRSDSNKSLTEFKSPKLSGKAEHSGYHGYDALVQAYNYVYASFDGIKHNLSYGDAVTLDESDLEDRAEVVMQDVADMVVGEKKSLVRNYINNLFDYKTAKMILAVYCASIFENPKEAQDFFHRNNGGRLFVEGWDKDKYPESPDKAQRLRDEEIISQMKNILAKFGIEPPLSLEVRIKDCAKVARAA
jgi:hypothetical protein